MTIITGTKSDVLPFQLYLFRVDDDDSMLDDMMLDLAEIVHCFELTFAQTYTTLKLPIGGEMKPYNCEGIIKRML